MWSFKLLVKYVEKWDKSAGNCNLFFFAKDLLLLYFQWLTVVTLVPSQLWWLLKSTFGCFPLHSQTCLSLLLQVTNYLQDGEELVLLHPAKKLLLSGPGRVCLRESCCAGPARPDQNSLSVPLCCDPSQPLRFVAIVLPHMVFFYPAVLRNQFKQICLFGTCAPRLTPK